MDNIPKYAPVSPLAKRLYAYLEKVWAEHPGQLVTRDQLMNVAAKAGVQRNEVWAALKELESVVDCISFWDSTARTVFFCVAPMTPEEKIKRIEDAVWFESLP